MEIYKQVSHFCILVTLPLKHVLIFPLQPWMYCFIPSVYLTQLTFQCMCPDRRKHVYLLTNASHNQLPSGTALPRMKIGASKYHQILMFASKKTPNNAATKQYNHCSGCQPSF